MNMRLCVNKSERNKITKDLTAGVTLSGELRNEANVVNPSIVISIKNPTIYNYAYIDDFKRYYFITDYISLRTGIWQINLKSDVLMSFKDSILASSVLINSTEEAGKNNYLSGGNWVAKVKDKTEIKTFPNGLLDTGEFILITAGG